MQPWVSPGRNRIDSGAKSGRIIAVYRQFDTGSDAYNFGMAEAKHSVELPRGADMHLHVRDGSVLGGLVLCSALQFSRAIIMPNTVPPITTAEMAVRYRERILEALATEAKAAGIDPVPSFEPLMTLYLTDQCTPEIIAEAKRSGVVVACKLYPAGATTNSQSGVTDIESIFPVLAAMEEHGLVLCVHGEVTDPLVDVFDRERVFIERVLRPIYQRFSRLRIVLEHATTEEAVNFVLSDETERVAATLTCHHLLHTRSDIFRGGLNPHYYCLPVLKSERDRNALLIAATGGSGRFFAGTDSAPHPRGKKGKLIRDVIAAKIRYIRQRYNAARISSLGMSPVLPPSRMYSWVSWLLHISTGY